MEYKCQQQVLKDLNERTSINFDDEYFYRRLIIKMINEIPLEDLKKVFKLSKIKPEDEGYFYEIGLITNKIQPDTILYKSEIEIN